MKNPKFVHRFIAVQNFTTGAPSARHFVEMWVDLDGLWYQINKAARNARGYSVLANGAIEFRKLKEVVPS